MLGNGVAGDVKPAQRCAAALLVAIVAFVCSSCGPAHEPSTSASAPPLERRCDPRAALGWCRVVCIDACAGDPQLGAAAAREQPRQVLDPGVDAGSMVVDAATTAARCALSDDGLVWYVSGTRTFPPIVARYARCTAGEARFAAIADPPRPQWSIPSGRTRALFVAGTLQDEISRRGTLGMNALARATGIPLTWMLGNLEQLRLNRDVYQTGHSRFGDDLQIEPYDDLNAAAKSALPWFRLVATIDGGGHERFIEHDLRMGARAFWGIAWNSSGIDAISDAGAPWGTYCADPRSYKRPAARGCDLVGIEWTARDLTRAFFSGHEEAYSTDPDDLFERAKLTVPAASAYARQIADAYAAAGATAPLVVMAQQESAGTGADPMRSWSVLSALYDEAKRSGMRVATMTDAVAATRGFGTQPRAVAFPYLPGLPNVFQGTIGSPPVPYPATIDYVDRAVGMTFVAGRTVPVRVFPYDLATVSQWDRPLPQLPPGEFATLSLAAVDRGRLVLQFDAPVAQRFGIAIWSDPRPLGWDASKVVPAGRAGAVAAFDLPEGVSHVEVGCAHCTSLEFPLSR